MPTKHDVGDWKYQSLCKGMLFYLCLGWPTIEILIILNVSWYVWWILMKIWILTVCAGCKEQCLTSKRQTQNLQTCHWNIGGMWYFKGEDELTFQCCIQKVCKVSYIYKTSLMGWLACKHHHTASKLYSEIYLHTSSITSSKMTMTWYV